MPSTQTARRFSAEDAANVRPSDLPAPPREALRVVQACADPHVTSQHLADLVNKDPAMTAEILRIANSALFGLSNQVKSVSRAVTVLGHRALRNVILCISMRDALRADAIPGLAIDDYWEDALFRAVAARTLASVAGLDEDECFTAGLLQDFGLLVLFYLMPQQSVHWATLATATPTERRELELSLFHATHDQIGLALAKNWDLPTDLAVAMGYHHTRPPMDVRGEDATLCHVAECADWMAAVFRAEDKRLCVQTSRELLLEHFHQDAAQVALLLDRIPDDVENAAVAMGLQIDDTQALDALMRDANLRLAEENLSYQELTWQLEQALNERDHLARELRHELEMAREVQRSLLPPPPDTRDGIAGINLSAKEVSGDFYDFYRLRDDRVLFCIADVSGKGMNAALLMAKASSLFRCLGKGVHDPARLLNMLNREIYETSIRGMFVTMIAGIFDPSTTTVKLANAGHLPALLMSPYTLLSEHAASAPPLGIAADIEFTSEEFRLGSGSLCLCTDGLLEARTAAGGRLEQAGLIALLAEHADRAAEERVHHIAAAVNANGDLVDDDLTLMLIDGRHFASH